MIAKAEREARLNKESQEQTHPDFDDEAEGGEWVTHENLYSHIAHGDTQALNLITQDPLPEITSDEQYPAFGGDDEDDKPEVIEEIVSEVKEVVSETPKVVETPKKVEVEDPSPKKVIFLTSDFAM